MCHWSTLGLCSGLGREVSCLDLTCIWKTRKRMCSLQIMKVKCQFLLSGVSFLQGLSPRPLWYEWPLLNIWGRIGSNERAGSVSVVMRKMGCVALLGVIQQLLVEGGGHDGQSWYPLAVVFEDLVLESGRRHSGMNRNWRQSKIKTVRIRVGCDVSATICWTLKELNLISHLRG